MLLKKLRDATGFDTSKFAAKRDFIALKDEVDKVDINKWVSVPTGLNNLKWKIESLDVDKLKAVPVDMKKLNYVVSKEFV